MDFLIKHQQFRKKIEGGEQQRRVRGHCVRGTAGQHLQQDHLVLHHAPHGSHVAHNTRPKQPVQVNQRHMHIRRFLGILMG